MYLCIVGLKIMIVVLYAASVYMSVYMSWSSPKVCCWPSRTSAPTMQPIPSRHSPVPPKWIALYLTKRKNQDNSNTTGMTKQSNSWEGGHKDRWMQSRLILLFGVWLFPRTICYCSIKSNSLTAAVPMEPWASLEDCTVSFVFNSYIIHQHIIRHKCTKVNKQKKQIKEILHKH